MDKTVPPGAALLLGFIYRTETSREPPECYEVIFGHNQDKLPKPITSMTLDEVEAAQAGWSKKFGSSAAGAAQFMKNTLDAPGTLQDIEGEMGLTGREKFSPDLQDRMAFHLLKRRGYAAFVAGRLSTAAFGKKLAQEWASLPVLADTRGAHRDLVRGQSYYLGDGVNAALVDPTKVEAVLAAVLKAAKTPSAIPTPKGTAMPAENSKVVDVKSAWSSKINWTVMLGFIFTVATWFGVPLDEEVKGAIITLVNSVLLIGVWVMRTWFTSTVTAAVAKKL